MSILHLYPPFPHLPITASLLFSSFSSVDLLNVMGINFLCNMAAVVYFFGISYVDLGITGGVEVHTVFAAGGVHIGLLVVVHTGLLVRVHTGLL